eukprot:15554204-Heterocapsa_arctica.AAC.1
MQIRVLPMRDQSPIDQRHHVVDARFVVDYQEDIRRCSFEDFDSRVEFCSSGSLLRAWDHS